MARDIKMPMDLLYRDQYGFFDDFLWYISPHLWTALAADAGVTAPAILTTLPGGWITMGDGVTAQNEVDIYNTNTAFLVANNRPLLGEARIQYAEAATNQANVCFGFADSANFSDILLDAGGGPRTSGNQLLIYKVAGGTVWRAQARNGTAFSDSISSTTAGGTNPQTLRIEVKDMSTTQATVYYTVDGVPLRDAQSGMVINHQLNISGSALMRLGLYLKGGSVTAETLTADYLCGYQVRV